MLILSLLINELRYRHDFVTLKGAEIIFSYIKSLGTEPWALLFHRATSQDVARDKTGLIDSEQDQ